jgi:hypothetical protein
MEADAQTALTGGSALAAKNEDGARDLVGETRNPEDGADTLSDYSDASRVSADDDLDKMLCPLEAAAASRGPSSFRRGGGAGADPAARHASRGPPPNAPRRARTEQLRSRARPPPRTKHPHLHVGGSVGDATASSMSSAEDAAAPEKTSGPSANAPAAQQGKVHDEAEAVDAFADLGVVALRDEDEVEFGEGITMREDEEEQEITLGRDMFARSRNVAMIWGSTTSAVTPQASSSYSSASASSPASTQASPHPSSPASESSPRAVLALPPTTEASFATSTSPLACASAPAAAAVLRAVSILLSQPGARAASFATAMRALAARKDACSVAGGQHALQSAAGVADGVHRRGGAAPPRPLPPATAVAPTVRWGPRPSFSAALSLPLTAALVAAMFATAGDLSVRRAGRGAVELRVDDPSAKLSLVVDLRERRFVGSDVLIVDVRIRRAPCNPLATFLWQNRKQHRASYDRAVADAESRWRALGCPAAPKDDASRDKAKTTLSVIRIVATKGAFGAHQRHAISGGDARRHTMAI